MKAAAKTLILGSSTGGSSEGLFVSLIFLEGSCTGCFWTKKLGLRLNLVQHAFRSVGFYCALEVVCRVFEGFFNTV